MRDAKDIAYNSKTFFDCIVAAMISDGWMRSYSEKLEREFLIKDEPIGDQLFNRYQVSAFDLRDPKSVQFMVEVGYVKKEVFDLATKAYSMIPLIFRR